MYIMSLSFLPIIMSVTSLPINYWPEINLTYFVYNNTNNICRGNLTHYEALQSRCLNNFDQCCDELALQKNITLNKCFNSSIYHCAQVSNPPNEEIISGFEWALIILGGITMAGMAIFILVKLFRCLCCRNREYSELR